LKAAALFALLAAAALGGAEAAELERLPPPEAVPAEAADLHAEIQRIVAARDLDALAALADPAVRLSFGDDAGIETLRAWAAEDWFWPEWARIAAHPPALSGSGADAYLAYPWYFAEWPERFDSYDYGIGLDGAMLRERPEAAAPVLANLSFSVFSLEGLDAEPRQDGWRELCLEDGLCGYVEDDNLGSPIGWRAIFENANGRWRMTAFIAGD
jgi:hypothetical protein